jgi:hypothetical protein
VPEWRRLGDLVSKVDLKEGRIDMSYNGEQRERREQRRREMGGAEGMVEGIKIITRTLTGAPSMKLAEPEEGLWS